MKFIYLLVRYLGVICVSYKCWDVHFGSRRSQSHQVLQRSISQGTSAARLYECHVGKGTFAEICTSRH
jgi:hypothetical protein